MYPLLWVWSPWLLLGYLLAGLASIIAVAAFSLAAPRVLLREPRSLGQLKLAMLLTAIGVVLVSSLLLWLGVELLGFDAPLLALALLVAAVGIVEWLISPYVINMLFRCREAGPELDWLKLEVEQLAAESGLRRTPKLMVAEVDVPNAFAYGSPLAGYYVAVTRGLLELLPREEVVAVVGHELGHLKHRDVAIILALSLLPALVYWIGRILIDAALLGGFSGRRGREGGGGDQLLLVAAGAVLVAASVVVNLLVLHFNRLREYYADAHSALVTRRPRLLQRALARLHVALSDPRAREEATRRLGAARMLLIVSPLIDALWEPSSIDELVEELKRQEVPRIVELFSTHPPVPKRLRFLDALAGSL